jgi:hypothetical protein
MNTPLVTLGGDGTFRVGTRGVEVPGASGALADATGARAGDAGNDPTGDPRLSALTRLRSLLGDDLEGQIATRPYLPAALGSEPADHLLPASLALLAGTTGDLSSYGWRVGPGTGRAWRRARELRDRMADAARIALFGYEGPLTVTVLGPLTLAAATFLPSGERTLSDRGALRDLPVLLAEGVAEYLDVLRERVPGAQFDLLVREDRVGEVQRGSIPTPSGYRRYPALPAAEIGPRWTDLVQSLGDVPVSLHLSPDPALLGAARTAGLRRVAVVPEAFGQIAADRVRWEALADAREAAVSLELVVDPARIQPQLNRFADGWRELGYGSGDLAGFTVLAHRPSTIEAATQPTAASLLTEQDIENLLRAAPAWAEKTQG